jgi:hypothetical protein
LTSNNPNTLLYINGEIGSVFRSQVAELLLYYEKNNLITEIYLLCGIKNKDQEIKVREIFKGSNIQLCFFKNYPNYFFFNIMQSNEISRKIRLLSLPKRRTIVHVRGELLAYHSAKGIKKSLGSLNTTLVDVRGAGWEETVEFQGGHSLKNKVKFINYRNTFKSLPLFGAISTVSESLKKYLLDKAPGIKKPIHIVHCLVSPNIHYSPSERKLIRDKFKLSDNDKMLIFSSGGTAAWQLTGELSSLISEKWTILNLSPNKIELKGVINDFVSYEKIGSYLSAADAALIFRSKSIVNKVACPVKFCEYLCAGLPVISDRNVDLINDYLRKTGFGIALDKSGDLIELPASSVFAGNRKEIQNAGRRSFGIEKISRDYIDIYNALT